jgi:hypothetical protein
MSTNSEKNQLLYALVGTSAAVAIALIVWWLWPTPPTNTRDVAGKQNSAQTAATGQTGTNVQPPNSGSPPAQTTGTGQTGTNVQPPNSGSPPAQTTGTGQTGTTVQPPNSGSPPAQTTGTGQTGTNVQPPNSGSPPAQTTGTGQTGLKVVPPAQEEIQKKQQIENAMSTLASKDSKEACRAVQLLLGNKVAEMIPYVIIFLQSPREDLHGCVKKELKKPETIDLLIGLWKTRSLKERIQLMRIIAETSSPRMIDLYQQSAQSLDPEIRYNTAIGLQNQKKQRGQALALLTRLASDDNDLVRRGAYLSLAEMQGADSYAVISSCMKKEKVRENYLLLYDIKLSLEEDMDSSLK